MTRQQVVPPSMAALVENVAYSPAVRVGDLLLVSGQVGRDRDLRPVVGDLEQHVRAAFDNLRLVVEHAGGSLADVVELTTYHVDIESQLPTFMAVKREYFGDRDTLPAWTAVGISALTTPDYVVEIQATAYLGD
ncbi:RidA family protein [Aeromicrobium alkaliterrae]|uniref:RidA family protein n=1 Tax=Aeromicrobium alkaliterrae TaxID=302168 RepID=A0ABP4VSN7_9ACTN